MRYIFDVEGDGIKATKLHCLSYSNESSTEKATLYTYDEMRTFFLQPDLTLIGHNTVRFDIPTLERILNIKINAVLRDTLAISYYLDNTRLKHGLGSYGEQYGVSKPTVTDWESLTKEEYGYRCSEDVKINTILWNNQIKYLWMLYDKDREKLDNFLDYLTFKMDCLREQEEIGLKLNKKHVEETLKDLEGKKEEKIEELKAAMPKVPILSIRKAPKNPLKADGTLSSKSVEWHKLLEDMQLAPHTPEVQIVKGYEEGNPNSHDQIKKWLYSLGWEPEHIKHVRDKKKGTIKKIPQIASKQGGGEICDSIKKLAEKEPSLMVLDGLSVLSHRIGIFKAFLENEQNERIYPSAMGLTNTLRLQHAVVVNLPSVEKKYGKEVRQSLISNEDCVLCGADLTGIEDSTKRHYIWKYDPAYVEEMSTEGFDAHLDIAMLAGLLTQEQVDAHKAGTENHKWIRQKAKVVNFSATYKVGAETLARNMGATLKEAKRILKTYWERNAAILKVEKELTVKQIGQEKWQLNPVSGYWYSLRAEKDRFSTLNQGTAMYVFDVWLMYMRQLGIKIPMQYHDEVLFNVKEGREERTKELVNQAILLTNNRLQLNVKISCSAEFGKNYAECH